MRPPWLVLYSHLLDEFLSERTFIQNEPLKKPANWYGVEKVVREKW